MKNGTIEHRPVVGLLTLLVIFAVLCLTILAVLSYSTAKYEKRSPGKTPTQPRPTMRPMAGVRTRQTTLCRLEEGGDLTTAAEKYGGSCQNGVVTFSRVVDDARFLTVKIDTRGAFTVTAWNTVPRGEWEADDSLHVWDGNQA